MNEVKPLDRDGKFWLLIILLVAIICALAIVASR